MRRVIAILLVVLSPHIAGAAATIEQAAGFMKSGDFAQAKTACESVIASNPTPEVRLSARIHLAHCRYYLQELDAFRTEATALLQEKALGEDDNEAFRYYLAMAESQKQNWAESKRLLLEFLGSEPKSPEGISEARYQAAMCAYLSGATDEFRQLAPASLELLESESSPTAQTRAEKETLKYHFAITEYQKGNWQQAKTLLLDFVSSSPRSADMVRSARFHAAMAAYNGGAIYEFQQLAPEPHQLKRARTNLSDQFALF